MNQVIDNQTPEELFTKLKDLLLGYPGLLAEDVSLPGEPMWRLDVSGQRAMHDPPSKGREYDRVRSRWRFDAGGLNEGLNLQLDLLMKPDGALKTGLYGRSKEFPIGDDNTAHATFKGRRDSTSGDYLVDFRAKTVVGRLSADPPDYLTLASGRPSRVLMGTELNSHLIHQFLLVTDLAGQARTRVKQHRDPAQFLARKSGDGVQL